MSEMHEKQEARGGEASQSQEGNFEEVLARAENLFRSSDYDGALFLLVALQERYVDATRLFDLMGEILIRRGDLGEGVRYRTLFQVLSNTLKVQGQSLPVAASNGPVRQAGALGKDPGSGRPDSFPVPETHLTAAMGRQLMQQGHYDQAQSVFAALLARNPNDEDLRDASESARKKSREKRVLSILERWLHSIDRMKSDRSPGA